MSLEQSLDVAQFHNGSHAVFRTAVEQYSPRLLPMVRSFAVDDDDAHDLLQDVWRRAYHKRHTFAGTGSLLGWLLAIARTVGLAALRRRASRDRFQPDPTYHTGEPPPDPSHVLEQQELARSIRRALLELPDRERDVVVLRLLEQRTTRETAALLGCAEGTVKASLHSALKKLRAPMEVWVQ